MPTKKCLKSYFPANMRFFGKKQQHKTQVTTSLGEKLIFGDQLVK